MNIRTIALGLVAIVATSVSLPVVAECDPDAARAFELGKKADQSNEQDDALRYFTNAAENCDRSDYWMALGDLLVSDFFGSLQPDELQERGGAAANAYRNAFSLARTEDEQFQAALGLIDLGIRSSDPGNARKWLRYASNVNPDSTELEELSTQLVNLEAEGISEMQVRRALMREVSLIGPSTEMIPSEPFSPGGGSRTDTVDVPIYFISNSVQPDNSSYQNVRSIADTLQGFGGNARFTFVGHADQRGDETYNLLLSQRRADAIKNMVEAMRPELKRRIATRGAGESQPVHMGTSPEAYRLNRRLEVLVEQ